MHKFFMLKKQKYFRTPFLTCKYVLIVSMYIFGVLYDFRTPVSPQAGLEGVNLVDPLKSKAKSKGGSGWGGGGVGVGVGN